MFAASTSIGMVVAAEPNPVIDSLQAQNGPDFDQHYLETDFDHALVAAMTRHEQTSLEAAQLALKRATRDDVKEFAQTAEQLRKIQLDELKALLKPAPAPEASGK